MTPGLELGKLAATGSADFGALLPCWSALPFAGLLLSLALFPLFAPKFWQRNYHAVVMSWALALAAPLLWFFGRPAMTEICHLILLDYIPFMILLMSLFTVAGGIYIKGALKGTPLTNLLLLMIGTIIASWIGTTGASMLLIRPVIRSNAHRKTKAHIIVFFIFLVSNIGGSLTPLGDPPLFLGYLRGVPFAWTFRLWPHWLLMVGVLLAAYFVWDSTQYTREPIAVIRRDRTQVQPLRVRGALNALWLAGVVLAVAFLHEPAREVAIVGLAVLSLWKTPEEIRRANGFTYYPIVEVAVLFFGIFLTMIPALEILRARGGELGVREPWQFFWVTGVLSSFLDNAPTYLTFLALGQGLGLAREVVDVPHIVLTGIAVGAVSMGANSYIGNAPNFMVKSIAEETGVRMPSFFGYMLYSGLILLPLFLLVTFLFF